MFLDMCLPFENQKAEKRFRVFEGEEGEEGTEDVAFPASESLNQSFSRSSISFSLKSSFLCCVMFTQAPSCTQGAAQARQQLHLRQLFGVG